MLFKLLMFDLFDDIMRGKILSTLMEHIVWGGGLPTILRLLCVCIFWK